LVKGDGENTRYTGKKYIKKECSFKKECIEGKERKWKRLQGNFKEKDDDKSRIEY
jgi:hypothetical protein